MWIPNQDIEGADPAAEGGLSFERGYKYPTGLRFKRFSSGWSLVLGDICYSRLYLSLEFLRYRRGVKWFWSWGRTYAGTRYGLIFGIPFFVFLGHIRSQ